MSAGQSASAFPHLVADIGGTNVRFALVEGGALQPEREMTLLCADYQGLEQAARHYLASSGIGTVKRSTSRRRLPAT